jgi:ribonuclease HII
MTQCNIQSSQYGFSKHKGYGTQEHIEAIKHYGLSDIHRTTFCKNILKPKL